MNRPAFLLLTLLIAGCATAQEITDPKVTEVWEPVPAKVTPGVFPNSPPSDAIILFDGKDLSQWHKSALGYGGSMPEVKAVIEKYGTVTKYENAGWDVIDGAMVVKPGAGPIETKQSFGDCQLHIEWLAPVDPGKEGQGYSNSGVFLMSNYEIQVLNSYDTQTYSNGQAGAMYKQSIPLVNASRPPGEWQTYDIVFMAPRFADDGKLLKPASITAFHNGVLIQNHFELQGPCIYIGKPYYIPHPDKLPLILQDHGNRVRFRNIWIREL
ncbi:MAG: DUF1080 domain-containing protein [Saprospiraceae bacterium]|nr:DUF1080 domain-containing protein [Lewinella sp.]